MKAVAALPPAHAGAATFVSGTTLSRAIADILAGVELRCAVAFWGAGAESRFDPAALPAARLVCNLESGSTNPHTIRRLIALGARIRTDQFLHGKVYISTKGAVITSANLSTNGLGNEDAADAFWQEAGVVLPPGPVTADALAWFETVWAGARDIEEADLAAATAAWKTRQNSIVTIPSFGALAADQLDFLVAWAGNDPWSPIKTSIREQIGRFDEIIERRLQNGAEIEDQSDLPVARNKWILWWSPDFEEGPGQGLPLPREPLRWTKLGKEFVKGAYRMTEDRSTRDVLLEDEQPGRPPFDPTERRFVAAFNDCLLKDGYRPLLEIGYAPPWFAQFDGLIARFRLDLYARYHELAVAEATGRSQPG